MNPTGEPVSDVTRVAMCRPACAQITAGSNGAAIIHPCSHIVLLNRRAVCLIDALRQSVSPNCPHCTISDHLGDCVVGAGSGNLNAAVVTTSSSIVILQQARVTNG
jgi:hypothetical protein